MLKVQTTLNGIFRSNIYPCDRVNYFLSNDINANKKEFVYSTRPFNEDIEVTQSFKYLGSEVNCS